MQDEAQEEADEDVIQAGKDHPAVPSPEKVLRMREELSHQEDMLRGERTQQVQDHARPRNPSVDRADPGGRRLEGAAPRKATQTWP